MRDIIPPPKKFEHGGREKGKDELLNAAKPARKSRKKRRVFLLIFLVIILSCLGIFSDYAYKIYIVNGKIFRKSVLEKTVALKESMIDIGNNARNNDFLAAEKSLENSLVVVKEINRGADDYFKYFPDRFFSLGIKEIQDINDARLVFKEMENILSAAKDIAEEGGKMSKELSGLIAVGGKGSAVSDNNIFKNLDLIGEKVDSIGYSLAEINKRSDFISVYLEDFKNKYILAQNYLKEFKMILASLNDLLGKGGRRQYVVLFQNSSEIRATGGFLGSYGIITVENGRITDFHVDDIYNPDGQLKLKSAKKVIPPRPLWHLTINWGARDANWFFDFETSAKKVLSFLEDSGSVSQIDGVIAINTQIIPKILEITGPVELKEYNETITASDFLEKVQYAVEEGTDRALFNQPKRILTFLGPELLKKIASAQREENERLLKEFYGFLEQKEIMFFSRNFKIQELIERFGFDGKVLPSDISEDYLAVVNSNVAGAKTDAVISQNIELSVEINESGEIINTLKVMRKHSGKDAKYSWWRKTNKDYVRIYVPKGSEFLEIQGAKKREILPQADYISSEYILDSDLSLLEKNYIKEYGSGTDVFEESGKTVFGNWLFTEPGEEAVLLLKYKLPYTLPFGEKRVKDFSFLYRLLYQKQSGVDSGLTVRIKLPDGFKFAETPLDSKHLTGQADSNEAFFSKDKVSKIEEIQARIVKDDKMRMSSEELRHIVGACETGADNNTDMRGCVIDEAEIKSGKSAEINLNKMKIRLYEDGVLKKEYDVLQKGDPSKWWQTPTGFFKAGYKVKNQLSSIFPVFMPYAVQIYEDFFIHGIPYYENGENVSSAFSGGCIRLNNEDAKEVFAFMEKGTPIIIKEDLADLQLNKGFALPVDSDSAWLRQHYNSPFNIRGYYGRIIGLNDLDEKYYQHTGIDLAAGGNISVKAAASGKVAFIQRNDGMDFGFGNAVILEHLRFNAKKRQNEKFYTLYGHLAQIKDGVEIGKKVEAGEEIGKIGASGFGCQNYWRKGTDGCDSGNESDIHLHFEIKEKPVLENPTGGKTCLNKKSEAVYCYGYTPSEPSKYGYYSPLEFLQNAD